MNDQFSNDSLTDSTATDSIEKSGKRSMLVGSLVCGTVPALLVGFGAVCYHTGYEKAVQEARPTIVHGNQYNHKTYQIAPSIGSNNNQTQTESQSK